jgi:hypothetical protein
MDDFVQFVVMVLILGVVAVFTWVRKTIEKMREGGEGGKPVDVAKSVRAQLQKYMQAAGHLDPMSKRPTGVVVTEEGVPAETKAPPVQPAAQVFRPAPEKPKPVIVEAHPERLTKRRALKNRTAAATIAVETRRHYLGRQDVRRAIVMAELLGPPVANRKDYRLF